MIAFKKFETSQENLIKKWLVHDDIGMRFLPSYAKTEDFVHLVDFDKRFLWIASDSNTRIGFFDLEIESADKGYFTFYLAPEFRGKGLGKLLLKGALELPEVQKVKILEGGIEKENIASKIVLEKLGFVYYFPKF